MSFHTGQTFTFGETPSATKWNYLWENDEYLYSMLQLLSGGFKLLDTSGNEIIIGVKTASAVNELTATNAATGNNPSLAATGGDTNVGLNLVSKGSGEIQLNGVGITGAWTSFTPTLANLTIGNGTITAAYKQIGKTIIGHVKIVFGSTTSMGSSPTMTVPVAAASYYSSKRNPVGIGIMAVAAANIYVGGLEFSASTTVMAMTSTNVAGGYGNPNPISSTIPTTGWTTNDYLSFTFEYEAA